MKRLFLMIAAAACIVLPLGDLALAQGRGHGRDDRGPARAERQHGPPDRGRPDRGSANRGDGRRFEDRQGPRRNYERGDRPGRFESRRDGRRERREDDPRARRGQGGRHYEAGPPRAFAPQRARRGGYLPDRFRGGVVEDYRRYRLRPPPHGYAWVRVGDGFALVSEDSGRVFDIVPD